MSHNLTIQGHTANFNGDFSGEVIIWLPQGRGSFAVPFVVLETIVAEKVRRQRISALEDASPSELLL